MSDLGTGAPSTQGDVEDFSSISNGVLKGINIFIGITERGKPGVPQLLRSENDYRKYFGGMLSTSRFPYMILRHLKRGGRCYVIPVGHYTDVDDATTLVGTAATATVSATISTVLNSAVFTATSFGTWANGNLKVTVKAAASGDVNLRDILIELAGYPELTQTIPDVPKNPNTDEKADFNRRAKLVQLGTVTVSIPIGTATAASGARDTSVIVEADYIGSSIGRTGIYAANSIKDAVRIAIPEMASNAIDLALAAYVDARKDILGATRTPLGLDGDTVLEYRNATGSYTGTAVDSWRMVMWTGGLKTLNSNKVEVSHPELADVLVNYSLKDANQSANFSPSGLKRGIIKDAIGVVYDFGDVSRATEYGKIYQQGVNAVISDFDEELGNVIRLDGNRTLYKKSSLLQKANIAEYLIWLYRLIQPKVKYQQFDPNDPIMWLELYNAIKPALEKSKSKKMRAIYDYRYIGDQFVQNAEDAVFNELDDLNAGIYKIKVLIKPTPAAEWIGYAIGVTNLGVNFDEIIE
jgi:hypothetical protein